MKLKLNFYLATLLKIQKKRKTTMTKKTKMRAAIKTQPNRLVDLDLEVTRAADQDRTRKEKTSQDPTRSRPLRNRPKTLFCL